MRTLRMWIVALALAGCGPSFTVVRQAAPNPLAGVKRYALLPVTFNGFTFEGKSEAEWLATRTPEQQTSWANDKANATPLMRGRFLADKRSDEEIVDGEAPFAIAINAFAYQGGGFHWTLQVRDASGNVVDEVRGPVYSGGWWGLMGAMNMFVGQVPLATLKYLRTRYSP